MMQQVYIRSKAGGMEAKVVEYQSAEKSYYHDLIVAELPDGARTLVMVTNQFDMYYELFTKEPSLEEWINA